MRAMLSIGVLVSLGLIAGRIFGLLREILVAANFGTGAFADKAIGLLIFPDVITMILIGSAASATLVPAFAGRSVQGASALFFQASAASAAAALLVAVLLFWQIRDAYADTPGALLIVLLSLPFSAVNAVAAAWLQHKDKLLVPAFSNLIFNVVIVIGLWLMTTGLVALGVTVFAAAIVRLAAHVVAIIRTGGMTFTFFGSRQLTSEILRNYAATVSTGFFSVVPHYAPYMILAVSVGGVALFNYAFKLVLLPAMLIATVIQMGCLQWFVRLHNDGLLRQFMPQVIRMALAVSVAVVLCVVLASQYIAQLCFGYGEMLPDDVYSVGHLLSIGIWSLPGIVIGTLWQQFFFAQQQTRAPLILSAIQSVVIVPACWLGQHYYDVAGVMLALAVVQSIPLVCFGMIAARQKLLPMFPLGIAGVGIVCAVAAAYIPMAWIYQKITFSPLIGLIVAVSLGAVLLLIPVMSNPQCRQWMAGHGHNK